MPMAHVTIGDQATFNLRGASARFVVFFDEYRQTRSSVKRGETLEMIAVERESSTEESGCTYDLEMIGSADEIGRAFQAFQLLTA